MRMIGVDESVRYAGALVLGVLLLNALEFAVGHFPGYGTFAMFIMAGLGVVTVFLSLASLPLRRVSKRTSVSIFKFGCTLLIGYVPTYLIFGCVFFGCPG